jgi:hypothetical protein
MLPTVKPVMRYCKSWFASVIFSMGQRFIKSEGGENTTLTGVLHFK